MKTMRSPARGSAKFLDGAIGVPGVEIRHSLSVELAAAGLLVRVEAGDQMAHGGKACNRGQCQEHNHNSGGTRDHFGQELEHVSRPEITVNHSPTGGLCGLGISRFERAAAI
jgi:hypothetical protein